LTPWFFWDAGQFVGSLEVAQEGFSRFDGDDRPAVLPDAIEQHRE